MQHDGGSRYFIFIQKRSKGDSHHDIKEASAKTAKLRVAHKEFCSLEENIVMQTKRAYSISRGLGERLCSVVCFECFTDAQSRQHLQEARRA